MQKMTVIGRHDNADDDGVFVEHVRANDAAGAIIAACRIDPDRISAEITDVLKGHVTFDPVDPNFDLGYVVDLPSIIEWPCPHCNRKYDRRNLPNECECGTRPAIEEALDG